MANDNKKLARIFKELAAIYRFLGDKHFFRARAYDKAARIIGSWKTDVIEYLEEDKLEELKGVGESIANKIKEFGRTGTVKKYEELKDQVPEDFIHLMDVKGLGPKTLKHLHDQLGIGTRSELEKVLEDGTVANLKGFGQKKVDNMLEALRTHKQMEGRMLLSTAKDIGDHFYDAVRDLAGVQDLVLAGSLRRKKATIGDIDLLVAANYEDAQPIIQKFADSEQVADILVKGDTKCSIIAEDTNTQVDLRVIRPQEWGAALLYFTGSKEHNVQLRQIAKDKGLKVSEYGIFEQKTNKRVVSETEEAMYDQLGLAWIPPELREDRGEIEKAAKADLPDLIELEAIKGDMQMHSEWSDGVLTMEQLMATFRESFQRYEYMALTDHSKAVRMAGGMDEKQFEKQINAIKDLRDTYKTPFLLAGAEIDVHTDGTLDLADSLVAQLDWVVASIHTRFDQDNTERLVRACYHPHVHVIGHPTGRLIGSREPYEVNMQKVIQAAKETGTALEVNAQPERLDLDDTLAMQAREAGVPLVISTDGHSPGDFHFMNFGLFMARRAWCEAPDVLNTWSLSAIQSWFDKHGKPFMNSVENSSITDTY